jgi:hypothetical protein
MSSYRRRQARRGRLLERPSRQPGIAHDYQKAFRVLRSLPCESFLASRSRMFNLTAKRQAPARGAKANPFMESAYLDESEAASRKESSQQQDHEKAARHAGSPRR